MRSSKRMLRVRNSLWVVALLLAAMPAAARASGIALSPAPGTPDASPATQISILGVKPARIRSVRLTGASTGVHPGRLRRYSSDRGASYLPAKPLAQGERARVVIRLRGRRAAIRYSFAVARLGPPQPALNLRIYQPAKLQHFVSVPSLLPPVITRLKGTSQTSLFLTPLPSPVVHPGSSNTVTISPVGPGGPMILDRRGRLVWFRQLTPPEVAANLRVQRLGSRKVLTWWQGTVTPQAFGLGEGVIADHSYRTIRTVHAGNGYGMDIHEFTLTRGGDALFTIYSPVLVHLPGTPAGKLSPLLDAIVQEVDVRTGLVVWEWHSFGHIPLSQSYATPANSASYDAFHINSVQALPHGRVLLSARDTSAVYVVARAGGRIVWRLGGKASAFRLGHGARFNFQHDAELLSHNRISIFDDEAGPPQRGPYSRGIVLRLDMRRHRATLVREYRRSTDTSAQSEGSVQTLAGGNVLLGFGAQPFFSEFSSAGRLRFDASLPQDDGSYRVYGFPWHARPRTRPAVVVKRTDPAHAIVYASWNGATEVARWQVLAGATPGSLKPIASARRSGFETAVEVNSSASLFAVRALDSRGRALRTSAAVPAS
jgi:Arylsulfotransferase (ASST)